MAPTATNLLVGKIVGILENEASFTAGIHDQVDEIKMDLDKSSWSGFGKGGRNSNNIIYFERGRAQAAFQNSSKNSLFFDRGHISSTSQLCAQYNSRGISIAQK